MHYSCKRGIRALPTRFTTPCGRTRRSPCNPPRECTCPLPTPIEYPAIRGLRLVGQAGAIRFRTRLIFLTQALAGEYISLEETTDAEWMVCYGPLTLGVIDERNLVFNPGICWAEQARSNHAT